MQGTVSIKMIPLCLRLSEKTLTVTNYNYILIEVFFESLIFSVSAGISHTSPH